MADCWYLVHTKAPQFGRRFEPLAQEHLNRQGYRTYFPQLSERVRRFGHRVRVLLPLFPRYLFVNLRVGEQDFGPVRATKGVSAIVRFGEDYARVPDSIIRALKVRENEAGIHAVPDRQFASHVPIRINQGPFFGIEGLFLHDCGEDRVLVLLNILGRDTPVPIPESFVEPAFAR